MIWVKLSLTKLTKHVLYTLTCTQPTDTITAVHEMSKQNQHVSRSCDFCLILLLFFSVCPGPLVSQSRPVSPSHTCPALASLALPPGLPVHRPSLSQSATCLFSCPPTCSHSLISSVCIKVQLSGCWSLSPACSPFLTLFLFSVPHQLILFCLQLVSVSVFCLWVLLLSNLRPASLLVYFAVHLSVSPGFIQLCTPGQLKISSIPACICSIKGVLTSPLPLVCIWAHLSASSVTVYGPLTTFVSASLDQQSLERYYSFWWLWTIFSQEKTNYKIKRRKKDIQNREQEKSEAE